MRGYIQRVSSAAVVEQVSGNKREIGPGLVVFLGIGRPDGQQDILYLVKKLTALRIFADEKGRMNRSILDTGGEILSISQFTLYGDTKKGNRPGFSNAMPPQPAEQIYYQFNQQLQTVLVRERVKEGFFGQNMQVEIHNDGPVTFLLETGV